MPLPYWEIISGCWVVFWIFWSVNALRIRAARRRASLAFTILNTGLLYVGFVLVLLGRINVGLFSLRFTVDSAYIDVAGTALAIAGVALAIWSRRVLGTNWSGAVRISVGQHLVRSGPYAAVRNPIYSGMALAVFGTTLVAGTITGLLRFVLVVVSLWQKGRMEERFLQMEFDEEYAAYRRRVKSMIPFIL